LTEIARVRTGFVAGILLLIGIGVGVFVRTNTLEASALGLHLNHQVLDDLNLIALNAVDAENEFRRSGVNSEEGRRALERVSLHQREVDRLVSDNAVQRNNLVFEHELLRRHADALLKGSAGIAELDQTSTTRDLIATLGHMSEEEKHQLDRRNASEAAMLKSSRIIIAVASAFSLGMILLGAGRMNHDFRKRSAAEKLLAARDEQYRQVVDQAGDIIYRTDQQGRFTFCNQSALAMLHYQESEVTGRSYLKLIRQDKRREAERFYLRQFARKQKSTYYEFPVIDGHGRERWVGQNVQLILEGGVPTGFQAIARDITERKRAEFELQRSRNFVERIALATPGVLYVYDLDAQRNIFSNREIVTILGYKQEDYENFPRVLTQLAHPDDLGMVMAHYEAMRHAKDGEIRRLEHRMRHADGHWVWLSGRETAFERRDGLVSQVVGIAQDVTARKAAQDRLAYQANFDALTGLANRHHFWTRLQGGMRRASIEHSQISLCLFDVDHFKEINDRFGHAVGDEVLEAVGNIVREELRSNDMAGRLGGDEFCFALPGTDSNEAARVADRIRERLCTMAFGLDSESPFSVSATFGIAESTGDMDVKHLMEAADRALYRAKSAGRNRVCVDA
jgi:diguanylate cyclase (GGDEF)-like protein/PAS domain S-box-containing protein